MAQLPVRLRPRDPQSLARGYTPKVRRLEWTGIFLFGAGIAAWGTLWARLWWENPWVLLAAFASAFLAADLFSGLVHWAADSWGSADLPLIGPAFLRPFREHHVDPVAITRHDFVETNGNNCIVSLPLIAGVLCIPRNGNGVYTFFAAFWGAVTLWVLATNQFHKWAHAHRPPAWVAFLQRVHLILPPTHHQIHHTAPFHRYYCITSGWLNAPLTWIRFFPSLEWTVTVCTGWLPRQDDLGDYAAQKVLAEELKTAAPARSTSHAPGS